LKTSREKEMKVHGKAIIYDKRHASIEVRDGETSDPGCKVAGEIVDDELVNVRCDKEGNACTKSCKLHQREEGSVVHYWCRCE
jgi:hypothetical protein